MDEPKVLKHVTGGGVVFRHVYPRTEQSKVPEDVIKAGNYGRRSVATMLQIFASDKDG